jgi:hypothetical protein
MDARLVTSMGSQQRRSRVPGLSAEQSLLARFSSRRQAPSDHKRVHSVAALIACVSVLFYLFFQFNKRAPLGDINPFAQDPYDAVGSFAIQVALVVSLLTYARALRLRADPAQTPKLRLILRGSLLVLFAIGVTLLADVLALALHPLPQSRWSSVLLAELASMLLLSVTCAVALAAVFRRIPTALPPRDLTPADAIDDLWCLTRIPIALAARALPRGLVDWASRFDSDRLFRRALWLNPRTHPWRFAFTLALLAGVGLAVAQRLEGAPPSLQVGLLAAGILTSAETGAAMAGFALLGGYLGLRPLPATG